MLEEIERARAARAAGRSAVALLSPHVPAELVRAAGAEPILLWPRFAGDDGAADAYLEYFFPTSLRVWFERALDGTLAVFDLFVIPRTAEFYAKFYLYLREAQRQEPARAIPPLHLFDLLQTPGEAIRRHNRGEAQRLFDRVLRGRAPAANDLRQARDASAATRAIVRAATQALRGAAPRITGGEATAFYRAARAQSDAELQQRIATLQAQPVRSGPRLLLLGADLPSPDLVDALEANGATIVAEEHGWGARGFDELAQPSDDPLDAIAQRVRLQVPSPRSFDAARDEAWIRDAAQAGKVQGAVFVVPSTDDSYGWDYPARRDLCHALGLKTLLLRPDDRSQQAIDRGAIADFLASLGPA